MKTFYRKRYLVKAVLFTGKNFGDISKVVGDNGRWRKSGPSALSPFVAIKNNDVEDVFVVPGMWVVKNPTGIIETVQPHVFDVSYDELKAEGEG